MQTWDKAGQCSAQFGCCNCPSSSKYLVMCCLAQIIVLERLGSLTAYPVVPEPPTLAGLASYHVQGQLHGLLQPKELPGHQVDPTRPHSAGLMHPVLLGVPARLR